MELNRTSSQNVNMQQHNVDSGRPDVRTYEEMVKRIPKEDLSAIEEKMEGLTDVDYHLDQIKNALKSGDYKSLSEDAFFYALKGLKEGKIEAKIVMRISDIETLRRQGVEFGVIDPLEKYQEPSEQREFIYRLTGKHLQGAQLDRFIETMKAMPKEDRLMMVFNSSKTKVNTEVFHQRLEMSIDSVTISQVIDTMQKMNVFNQVKMPGETKHTRYFASVELFEAMIQERFQGRVVQVNPVFGISTPEQIEQNGLTSTRDVCHFYLVPEPNGKNRLVTYERADGHQCIENDFNYHDRYHAFVTSSVGKEDRLKSVSIAKKIKNVAKEKRTDLTKQDYKAFLNFGWQLKDMDFASYYKLKRISEGSSDPAKREIAAFNQEKIEKAPYLAYVNSVTQLLPMLIDVTNAYITLNDPQASNTSKQQAETLLGRVRLEPFETLEGLTKAMNVVADEIIQDPNLNVAFAFVGHLRALHGRAQVELDDIMGTSDEKLKQEEIVDKNLRIKDLTNALNVYEGLLS